jgi:hypothetical protein
MRLGPQERLSSKKNPCQLDIFLVETRSVVSDIAHVQEAQTTGRPLPGIIVIKPSVDDIELLRANPYVSPNDDLLLRETPSGSR